jgi:hypothetical protein
MLPALGARTALAVVERQGAALQARFTARADNAAEIARLRDAATRITDVDALLRDRRALTMVLEAFQLESEIDKRALLRRVMTEDPAASSSLVNRLSDPRWRQLADAVAPQRRVELTATQIAARTPEQIRALPLNRLAGLDTEQVRALTINQVRALDPAQLAAITPEALTGMDVVDLAAMSAAQVAALSPAQIRALQPFQVAAIEPADLAALGTDQIRALVPTQIRALTTRQIGALTDAQIGAFDAAQARAVTTAQRDAFTPAQLRRLDVAPPRPAFEPTPATRGPLEDVALVDRIVQAAMVNRFEKAMGESNPGLREALYFRRMAGQVTTINQLMSDRALLEVARGALGLPPQFALLPFEKQRDTLTRRLDVAELQDPVKVARMASRYVLQAEPAAPSNPALALLARDGGTAGLTALIGRRVSFSA